MVAAVATTFIVKNDSSEHVRDYQPGLTQEKQQYALKDARYQYYTDLLGNSKTGKIEGADRYKAWQDMQANRYNEVKSLSLTFEEKGTDNIGGRT